MKSYHAEPSLVSRRHHLQAEIVDLRRRLEDAEETLSAITGGRVDALVVEHPIEERQVLLLGDEAHDIVRAIQRGESDAVVVSASDDAPKVLLLGSAERRYRLLVEHMRDGAVTLSAAGDVLYANPRFMAMLGVSRDAVIGRRLADFLDPRHHALVTAMLDRRRGSRSQVELTIARNDGASFDAILTPVPAADGEEFSFVLTDVTDRNRLSEAEDTLRAIGRGEVDAFVVARAQGDEIELLTGAHRPYRLMVEKMQQGAVTLSSNGEILYTNQPFATMLGRSLSGLIDTRLETLVASSDHALLAALVDARHGGATQGELTLLHENGSLVPVLVAVALLPDEGGVCLIVTDLTAQKAYEAIVEAQALERSILDQAVDAIVLCDLQGRVIRASRAAFDLCGRNPLLQPFDDAFHLEADGQPPDLRAVQNCAATMRGAEYTLLCADGSAATVLLSAGPIVDTDGNPRGCVVTMTDITERRLVEDRLRESDRHKDEFLAILAHELRNPLAPIRNAVEILRKGQMHRDPAGSRAVDIIGRQSANLIRLVDDLLDINRISQGKIELQLAAIDMRSVVDQAIEICRPLIASRGHQFEATLPSQPVPVIGDAVRLSQVVVNLLSNAAKYTPPSGRIELALSTETREAVVRVTDNGVGVPLEMLGRIFEPYQQVSLSRERAAGGLGLGLTVSRRLIEMHGGTVEAHSAGSGRGSQFVARLALAPESAEQADETPTVAKTAKPVRVLVVDDNRDGAETLAQLIEMSGHRVEIQLNGAAAIKHAMQSEFDVVLLDIGMPGMDGYEVARSLRDLPNGTSLLIIAMTGYGSVDDRRMSQESGIDHHLVKPVDLTALNELLAAR